MPGPAHTICPGCGLTLPSTGAAVERETNASAECWQRYQDVAGFELTHVAALGRFHQGDDGMGRRRLGRLDGAP